MDAHATIRHECMRIAGKKVESDRRFDVYNPYTGRVIGTAPRATAGQVADAFRRAHGFQPTLSRYDRQRILTATAEALTARKEEISNLITAESGLSKKDSLYEVGRAYDVFLLAGQALMHDDGGAFACDLTPHGLQRRIFTHRRPLPGVISAITPFNHPLNMVAHKIAPAIATNNRVVLKPAELTPLTALLLADVLYEAGLPPEMFSVITGLPEDLGDAMLTDDHIDLVTFTGSVPVGKMIADKSGYKRSILELGGNAPLIVMEDADLQKAAALAVKGATKNSGQRCTAVKRILVVDAVADDFAKLVDAETRKLKVGDPMDPETDIGTVITEQAATLFQQRVDDAVAQGAELLSGNQREGALYTPGVVDRIPETAELVVEETFGPVVPMIRVSDIDDAIRVANGTAFALSSGVCTNRMDYIMRFIAELDHGTCNVWEVPGYRTEMSPFGGFKDSGNGAKEGVVEAMKGYTNLHTFSLPWAA